MSTIILNTPVGPQDTWLANAVWNEASHLPLIPITSAHNDTQLILVRYTEQLHQTPFSHARLRGHGAMWSNAVTTYSPTTFNITGRNQAGKWKGLQVIRLSLPLAYQIPFFDTADNSPIEMGWTKTGSEFKLNFDIPVGSFANIAFDYDANSKEFVKPAVYNPPPFNPNNNLPIFPN